MRPARPQTESESAKADTQSGPHIHIYRSSNPCPSRSIHMRYELESLDS